MEIKVERDWDRIKEELHEEKARKEMDRLCKMIEAAEHDGDYELAERRSRRLLEMQNGDY